MDDGVAVDVADGGHDAVLQFLLRGDADVAEHGARQLREEAFDQIEPRAVLGGEHEGEAALGLRGQPRVGLPGDVRGMIVENECDRSGRRIGGVEPLQESDELARSMSFFDAGVHDPRHKIDAGEQAQRSAADIFVIARDARMAARDGRQVRGRRSDRLHPRLLS